MLSIIPVTRELDYLPAAFYIANLRMTVLLVGQWKLFHFKPFYFNLTINIYRVLIRIKSPKQTSLEYFFLLKNLIFFLNTFLLVDWSKLCHDVLLYKSGITFHCLIVQKILVNDHDFEKHLLDYFEVYRFYTLSK